MSSDMPVTPWDWKRERSLSSRPVTGFASDRWKREKPAKSKGSRRRVGLRRAGRGRERLAWVVEPGLAATLQDSGREGYQRFGVPVSGALDRVSLAIANILVGNAPHEAALEVLAAGLTVMVCAECVTLAVAGTADPFVLETAHALLRNSPFRSVTARRGDIVRFPPRRGALSFTLRQREASIFLPLSEQIHLSARRARRLPRTGAPGWRRSAPSPSRRLRPGSFIARCEPLCAAVARHARPNAEYFKPSAFETLLTTAYAIAPASDRMGLRLQGGALEHATESELPSQGTTAGGLQVPSDGQPILLLADRQTTGGYPRIATVIAADIAAAGRLSAGMKIRFQDVSREEAVHLLKVQRKWLASLPSLLKPVPAATLSAEHLLSSNLVGGVTAGAAED